MLAGLSLKDYGVLVEVNPDSVSIVIPTLNAAAYIPKLAESFQDQTLVPLEVLAIDSQSNDSTVELATSFGWMTESILRSEFDHGRTRNIGAGLTKGKWIVFLSQDAQPANRYWLENLVSPLRDASIGATFSRQRPRNEASQREKFARLWSYSEIPTVYAYLDVELVGIRAMFLSNVSSATRRSTFEEVGGFATRAILNEDGYFAAALLARGWSVAYVPTSEVWHSHDYSAAMQFRRYFDIGVSHRDGPALMRRARTAEAGVKFFGRQLSYLVKEGAYGECVLAGLDTAAKFLGYNLGKRYVALPVAWRRALGWNRRYWSE